MTPGVSVVCSLCSTAVGCIPGGVVGWICCDVQYLYSFLAFVLCKPAQVSGNYR